jgi:wobble nucleotide-excising tRNase
MTASILRLRQLRGIGIFADHTHRPSTPDFRRYNLVYGFNGSGKTTLSRVFQSVAAGKLCGDLPPEGQLSIELSDGTAIKNDNLKCAISPRILVFNQDFVAENLVWKSGEAKPVFYIGTAQANAVKLLQRLEARAAPRREAHTSAERECRSREREFASFKTDIGKLIAEELNLGRRYNAVNVEADFQAYDAGSAIELSDEQRKAKKALINREAPLPNVAFQPPPPFDSAETILESLAVCSHTLGGVMIDALQQHPSMIGWVKTGLDYHLKHSIADCLHCGQKLTQDRITGLQAAFDKSYDDHVAQISSCSETIVDRIERLRGVADSLPVGEFPADLIDRFTAARATLRDVGRRAYATLQAARNALAEKADGPNLAVAILFPEPIENIAGLDQSINDALGVIAAVVEEHNQRNSRFAAEQEQARRQLKAHYLRENHTRYLERRLAFEDADRERETRWRLLQRQEHRVATVRDKLRSHGPALETINKLLKSFLGHGELALATDGDGYRIQRRGKKAVGPLSEGEKTAVAFCYFLTKLTEDGRNLRDVIAVVDDPISSLDTKALNYAFNLMKRSLSDTGQVVILTHNMDFMNEAKKWLKGKAYPRDDSKIPTASMFFLSTAVSPCGTIRSSSIGELPTLLREYDSEYQYLFSLIFLFTEGRSDDLAYLMPNAMRKVLELFLAFKCPGSSGVEGKLEQSPVRDCGIDPASVAALARLSNVESHGDSLDVLIMLPTLTIEESKEAAHSLFKLMELLDADHFNGMKSISRRANPTATTHAAFA